MTKRDSTEEAKPRKQNARKSRTLTEQRNPCNEIIINEDFATLIQKMKQRYTFEQQVDKLEQTIKLIHKDIVQLDAEIATLFTRLQPYDNAIQNSIL